MSAWLLYGQRSDGELLHISEVPRGEACNCFCLHCQTPLAAKKGNVKVHHFAHLGKTCAYTSAYDFLHIESYLNTSLTLSNWVTWKQQDIRETADKLEKELAQYEQYIAKLFDVLEPAQKRLELISQPHLGRKQRSQQRQANYEVLQQWKRWITDHNANELDLERVRDPESCEYVLLIYRQHNKAEGYRYHIGRSVWPNEMWWEENKDEDWVPYWLAKAGIRLINEYHPLRRKLVSTKQQLESFKAEKARFDRFRIYFLHIEFDGRPPLFKVGITSRADLTERIAEIRQDLRRFGISAINVLNQLSGHAYLESYFKKKYSQQQVKLGSLTEYFDFDDSQLKEILEELSRLVPQSEKLVDRIKRGMARARSQGAQIGRSKGAEKIEQFLTKPKSLQVIRYLHQYPDWSLRNIANHSGIALNTVCKVAKHYQQERKKVTF